MRGARVAVLALTALAACTAAERGAPPPRPAPVSADGVPIVDPSSSPMQDEGGARVERPADLHGAAAAVSAVRALDGRRLTVRQAVEEGVPGLGTVAQLLAAHGTYLPTPYTLVAPLDAAFDAAVQTGDLACWRNDAVGARCAAAADVVGALNGADVLLGHVFDGRLDFGAANGPNSLVSRAGAAQVVVRPAATAGRARPAPANAPPVTLGGAAVLAVARLTDGVLVLVDDVLGGDAALNASAVMVAERLLGFGPLTPAERAAMFSPLLDYLPATPRSLLQGYGRLRASVDAGRGADAPAAEAPLALVYVPPFGVAGVGGGGRGGGGPDVAGRAVMRREAPAPDAGRRRRQALEAGATVVDAAAAPYQPGDIPTTTTQAVPEGDAFAAVWIGADPVASAAARGVVAVGGRQGGEVHAASSTSPRTPATWPLPTNVTRPADDAALAFLPVLHLAALLRARTLTSTELTEVYLERLARYDATLEAVVTLTPDLARAQAAAADAELDAGAWRGPLHGIPYGLKDVISLAGYPTTWGAARWHDRVVAESAGVVHRLDAAGAVHVAKLATGELAFDDVWWGGQVKNPWNIAQGASGSSAGPAAAVVAGLVAFALGTETQGSLVSPAARVGATALRPTFGLVGRSGVMRLADSLDKVGPICRTAADCAAVFDAVRGPDAHDPASLVAAAAPGALSSAGHPPPTTLHGLTIGVLKSMRTNPRAKPVLAALTAAGATMVDLDLAPTTPASDAATTILLAEAAANLDGWQRSGAAGGARRQDFWPPLLRLARLVPAVEYLTAQRARTRLAGEVLACLREAGVAGFVGNATELLAVSNLVGLATVVAPLDMARVPGAGRGSPRRSPGAVGFFAPPYGDAVALAMAQAWQAASTVHLLRPPIDDGVEASIVAECGRLSRCALPAGVIAELGPRDVAAARREAGVVERVEVASVKQQQQQGQGLAAGGSRGVAVDAVSPLEAIDGPAASPMGATNVPKLSSPLMVANGIAASPGTASRQSPALAPAAPPMPAPAPLPQPAYPSPAPVREPMPGRVGVAASPPPAAPLRPPPAAPAPGSRALQPAAT